MRLLLVSQYYEPAWDYGGPAAKVTAMSRHLSERGHEVDVLTSCVAAPQRNGIGPPGTTRTGSLTVHYLPAVLRYRGVTINPGVHSFCRRHLDRVDLVHIFGVYDWLGTMAYRAIRTRSKPYVVEPLGMYQPMERGFGRKWIYRRLVGEEFLRGAARVIATSGTEFEQLRSMGVVDQGNVVIRRNGVEVPPGVVGPSGVVGPGVVGRSFSFVRSRLGIAETDRIVLFLGRIVPIKQLELLIEAFAGLNLPDVHLLIVGPRPDEEYARRLREMASQLAGGRVHFHDAVHGPEKDALLCEAYLAVLSSRSESFGNVIAEAVASDVPVVVTEGCGVAPTVRDRVGLVVEASVAKYREALRQMLETPSLYARFKANCAEVKREFSWDEPIEMLERMYAAVLEESKSAVGRRQQAV